MSPDAHKVLIYATWQGRLLVFDEPDFPEIELQVPGGTMEPGESPEVAATREFVEETGLTPPQPLGPAPDIGVRRRDFDYCKIFPEDCDPTRWPEERYKPIPPLKGQTKRPFTEALWEPIDDALRRGLDGLGIKGKWNDRLRGWAKTGAKRGAEEGLDAILDAAGATGDTKKAAAAALKAAVQLEVPF